MEKIISPETLGNIPVGIPTITISKRSINFNHAASLTLNLKDGDRFVFVDAYGALHYKESQGQDGFKVNLHKRTKTGRAGSHKLYLYLKLEKTTKYTFKEFKNGMRQLVKL